jgi:hypothetical protein
MNEQPNQDKPALAASCGVCAVVFRSISIEQYKLNSNNVNLEASPVMRVEPVAALDFCSDHLIAVGEKL